MRALRVASQRAAVRSFCALEKILALGGAGSLLGRREQPIAFRLGHHHCVTRPAALGASSLAAVSRVLRPHFGRLGLRRGRLRGVLAGCDAGELDLIGHSVEVVLISHVVFLQHRLCRRRRLERGGSRGRRGSGACSGSFLSKSVASALRMQCSSNQAVPFGVQLCRVLSLHDTRLGIFRSLGLEHLAASLAATAAATAAAAAAAAADAFSHFTGCALRCRDRDRILGIAIIRTL
mmetsp:Transcript_28145/g.72025  ORF Transcript_28145/g.72025 Transcript_28145/m.72025 type:complete len:235 (+) Transcript_28145:1409-2113(+)